MIILLCGQKRFGRDALAMLQSLGHTIRAVAAPNTGIGTKDEDQLHFAATQSRLPIIPAGTLNHEHKLLEGIDLIVTAHSHDFVGRRTRHRARLGAIGYHPSLLPLHRGRDAIRWAIRMKEAVTGGSVYWLNDTVDGGPIAAQRHVFIRPGDTARELWRRDLAPLGITLLQEVITDLANGRVVAEPQDKSLATWEPSIGTAPPLHRPDLHLLPWHSVAATT